MQKVKDPGAHHASSAALIRRFLPYLSKYKAVLFLDLFCAALTTLCDIILPKIMSTITNSAMGVGIVLTPVHRVQAGGALPCTAHHRRCGAAILCPASATSWASTSRRICASDAFDHLLLLDHTYYNNTKVGTIMGRITNDLFDVTEFAHHCPEEFFIAAIKIRGVLPHPVPGQRAADAGGVCLRAPDGRGVRVPEPEAAGAVPPAAGADRRAERHHRGQPAGAGRGKGLCRRGCRSGAKFEQGNRDFEQIKTLSYYAMAAFNTSTRLFDGLMYLVVILAGGLSLVYGKITAGDLVAYMLYVTTLIATIRRIVEFAEQFQRGMTGIERFAEIMDTPSDHPRRCRTPCPCSPAPARSGSRMSALSTRTTTTRCCTTSAWISGPGERLALVGPSGGGKTTLCNLIPRFYDVTSGRILIDGQDIRHVTLKSLRQDIGIVQQDVYLFSGTVAQNIAYGKPGATREEIMEAAPVWPGAEKFILALKDGFDTYVGERGVKLSGGQKQRIAIARVFLKNPPILILDEATSALDNESEILVGQSLEKLAHGRTTLTIAHRLTTIKDYDRILVLGEEGIVESGTHDQLLAKQGVYYRLWNQLPGEDTL